MTKLCFKTQLKRYLCAEFKELALAIFDRIRIIFSVLFLTVQLMVVGGTQAFAAGGSTEGGKYDPKPMIMHHIADANEFHVGGNVTVPLPVIVYNLEHGDLFFGLSSSLENQAHGHSDEQGGEQHHDDHSNSAYIINADGRVEARDGSSIIDFSITKNVFTMLLAAVLMVVIFFAVAGGYEKRKNQAPKGIQNFFEPLILFVRDEIAKPNIGPKYEKFLPYLLTVFFFIWILNMLGQIPFFPGSANATGNIAVTLVLAFFTMILTNVNGTKAYWSHVFFPPVPIFVWPIMAVVEVIGVLTKPVALMIRLFANITAGHIIMLSLVSLIFVFGNAGQSLSGSIGGAAFAVPFVLFISVIELLVAFLQAFVFTILSAVFIGLAVEEAH